MMMMMMTTVVMMVMMEVMMEEKDEEEEEKMSKTIITYGISKKIISITNYLHFPSTTSIKLSKNFKLNFNLSNSK